MKKSLFFIRVNNYSSEWKEKDDESEQRSICTINSHDSTPHTHHQQLPPFPLTNPQIVKVWSKLAKINSQSYNLATLHSQSTHTGIHSPKRSTSIHIPSIAMSEKESHWQETMPGKESVSRAEDAEDFYWQWPGSPQSHKHDIFRVLPNTAVSSPTLPPTIWPTTSNMMTTRRVLALTEGNLSKNGPNSSRQHSGSWAEGPSYSFSPPPRHFHNCSRHSLHHSLGDCSTYQ